MRAEQIERNWSFKTQVKSLKLEPDVSIGIVKNEKNKKETDVQAITGATISSTAVVKILNEIVKETTKTIQSSKIKM